MMTGIQYGVLYKMASGWKLRCVTDGDAWLSKLTKNPDSVTQVSVHSKTLTALAGRCWITHIEMKWPVLQWQITEQGQKALHQEQIKRGAILKAMP
jgi:hypothetical protein